MKILVSNVGSTSLKFKLYEMPQERILCSGTVERVGSLDDAIFFYENRLTGEKVSEICGIPGYTEGIEKFTALMTAPDTGVIDGLEQLGAIGFKTVAAKGFYGVHEITQEVLDAMDQYMTIAPAHNKAYMEAIGCFRKVLPDTKFVGVFETAFHQTIPKKRSLYSLPYEWYEKYDIHKLGYHGASHSYSASVLEEMFGTTGKAVTCHLGGSGSICAIEDGKSMDNSFGMSLQIGLPQSNRCGDIDPYLIPYLEEQGLTREEIFDAMSSKSGLLGISGVGKDLRYIKQAAEEGNERAQLALDMFAEAILHYIGAYAAKMGGLDNLVFTGGIGENSVYVREEVCRRLKFMGLELDEKINAGISPENAVNEKGVHIISAEGSRVMALVIPADEEIVVCRKSHKYILDSYGCT